MFDCYTQFPHYTTFPIEKQESIPQKNNRRATQALLLSFLFLKTNLPYCS